MTLLTSEVQTLPGVPAPAIIAEALVALLAPIASDQLEIDDGPVLTPETLEAEIATLVTTRPQFSAHGKHKAELTMRWIDVVGTGVTMTGHLRTFVTADASDPNQVGPLIDALIATAQIVRAPFAHLDQFEPGFRDRVDQHRVAYQPDKAGADRVFGLLRGFSGVPWRTVLGPASVDFFGETSLAALPETLARQLATGYWLLSPCDEVDDWTADAYCDGERQIIDTLGADRFFNPETGDMPTVLPTLPETSDLAVTARRRDVNGEWQRESFGSSGG